MPVSKSDLVATRDFTPADLNFILATWLRGLRFGNDFFREIQSDIYFKFYHSYLERLLKHPKVTIKVSCLKDDPEVILGYAVFSGLTVHWVHVKAPWRGIGIAKSIVPENFNKVTHLTKTGLSLIRRSPGIIYDPFTSVP